MFLDLDKRDRVVKSGAPSQNRKRGDVLSPRRAELTKNIVRLRCVGTENADDQLCPCDIRAKLLGRPLTGRQIVGFHGSAADVGSLDVKRLLQELCESTSNGFVFVAVTDKDTWSRSDVIGNCFVELLDEVVQICVTACV